MNFTPYELRLILKCVRKKLDETDIKKEEFAGLAVLQNKITMKLKSIELP